MPALVPSRRLPAKSGTAHGACGAARSFHRSLEIRVRELTNTFYALAPGTSLHLDRDAVRVVRPDINRRTLLPLARIDHVVVFGGATASDELVCRLGADGKSVTRLTGPGRFLARASGGLRANRHPGRRRTGHTTTSISVSRSLRRNRHASGPCARSAWSVVGVRLSCVKNVAGVDLAVAFVQRGGGLVN
ncbi:CRISPR-associated endonuclease Cas1 [Flindersiella endophytica]